MYVYPKDCYIKINTILLITIIKRSAIWIFKDLSKVANCVKFLIFIIVFNARVL